MIGAKVSVASLEGRRILAIRAGALGDTILVLPALAALREAVGPSGSVELVGTEPSVRLAESPSHATAVHSIDRARFRSLYDEGAADDELLEFVRPFDIVVAWSRLPLLQRKLLALGKACLEASPRPPEGVHASEHFHRTLAPLGVAGTPSAPRLFPGDVAVAEARSFLERLGLPPGRFLAIHPSSGSARKNWPLGEFRAVAERARSEGWPLLWIEGEADSRVVSLLKRLVPSPVARCLPLSTLAAVLAQAGGFVGNDSGVSHLAAAVGTPSIVLFGPTDPRTWAPRGHLVRVLDFGATVAELWGNASEIFRTH